MTEGVRKKANTTPRMYEQSEEAARLAMSLEGKYLTFRLGAEEYGIEILSVRELIGYMNVTRVPRTRDFIRGVINLRGRIIPVVDLRMKFGMERLAATEQTVIIVVEFEHARQDLTMGIVVDEVLEVLTIPAEEIVPTPEFGTGGVDTDVILAIGKRDKGITFLLDARQVLSSEENNLVSASSINPAPPGQDEELAR